MKRLLCWLLGHKWYCYPCYTEWGNPPEPNHACDRCNWDIGNNVPEPDGLWYLTYRIKKRVKEFLGIRNKNFPF